MQYPFRMPFLFHSTLANRPGHGRAYPISVALSFIIKPIQPNPSRTLNSKTHSSIARNGCRNRVCFAHSTSTCEIILKCKVIKLTFELFPSKCFYQNADDRNDRPEEFIYICMLYYMEILIFPEWLLQRYFDMKVLCCVWPQTQLQFVPFVPFVFDSSREMMERVVGDGRWASCAHRTWKCEECETGPSFRSVCKPFQAHHTHAQAL